MKFKILCVLFTTFLSGSIFCATNYQEIFLQANEVYKKGEFSKAYDLYKSIPNPGSEINYNLGNCAYKLGQPGYALLYWRRAERLWNIFDRNELLDNISLLKSQFSGTDRREKNKVFELLRWIKNYTISVVSAIPLVVIQVLFLAIWFFLFLYVRFLFKRKRRFLIIVLFILISLLGTLLVVKYSLYYRQKGVIVTKTAILLSGPGNTFQKLGNLSEASEILIQKESGDFYKIKYNGQSGWVNHKEIEKI